MARFIVGGWASLLPSHFDDYASPDEPKNLLCGELYCVRFIEHVTGEEYYEWVIL